MTQCCVFGEERGGDWGRHCSPIAVVPVSGWQMTLFTLKACTREQQGQVSIMLDMRWESHLVAFLLSERGDDMSLPKGTTK